MTERCLFFVSPHIRAPLLCVVGWCLSSAAGSSTSCWPPMNTSSKTSIYWLRWKGSNLFLLSVICFLTWTLLQHLHHKYPQNEQKEIMVSFHPPLLPKLKSAKSLEKQQNCDCCLFHAVIWEMFPHFAFHLFSWIIMHRALFTDSLLHFVHFAVFNEQTFHLQLKFRFLFFSLEAF